MPFLCSNFYQKYALNMLLKQHNIYIFVHFQFKSVDSHSFTNIWVTLVSSKCQYIVRWRIYLSVPAIFLCHLLENSWRRGVAVNFFWSNRYGEWTVKPIMSVHCLLHSLCATREQNSALKYALCSSVGKKCLFYALCLYICIKCFLVLLSRHINACVALFDFGFMHFRVPLNECRRQWTYIIGFTVHSP